MKRNIDSDWRIKLLTDRSRALPEKPKTKRVSKAQALVDFGLADNLTDARAQLEDMGEL